ncbi:unnamed protein product [Closterium sp. Naga37s-1]|nr:unnamed protein product [Closterium sp. Naga37s-1]
MADLMTRVSEVSKGGGTLGDVLRDVHRDLKALVNAKADLPRSQEQAMGVDGATSIVSQAHAKWTDFLATRERLLQHHADCMGRGGRGEG